ncbi:MAG TPA: hypothetical protein VMJ52_03365 [Xanthobacteraceae bacterium]|nr:hypothetical protein [Xanthobacteraceae bacterium]
MGTLPLDTATTSVPTHRTVDPRNIEEMLEISQSRTYDAALGILGAYKLTGHFPTEFEIVLRDLGVLDKVVFHIKPKSPLLDTKHVVFRPTENAHLDEFAAIVRSIAKRIGSNPTRRWWVRLFQ